MKYSTFLATSLATTATALSLFRPTPQAPLSVVSKPDQKPLDGPWLPQEAATEEDEEQFLIELSPDKVLCVTEEEKWELRRVGHSSYIHQHLSGCKV